MAPLSHGTVTPSPRCCLARRARPLFPNSEEVPRRKSARGAPCSSRQLKRDFHGELLGPRHPEHTAQLVLLVRDIPDLGSRDRQVANITQGQGERSQEHLRELGRHAEKCSLPLWAIREDERYGIKGRLDGWAEAQNPCRESATESGVLLQEPRTPTCRVRRAPGRRERGGLVAWRPLTWSRSGSHRRLSGSGDEQR